MRLGLDALLLGGTPGVRQTGISRYQTCLVQALVRSAPEADMVLYALDESRRSLKLDGVRWRVPSGGFSRRETRILWEHTGLVAQAYRDHIDLLHGMAFVVPPLWRGASVVSVHDLAFMKLGGHAPVRRVQYLGRMIGQSVRRSGAVIAISEHTKRDIVDLFDIDPAKIIVTPLGVTEGLAPLSDADRISFRKTQNLERPTLLYLGTLEPRKNIPNLLRAFDLIAASTGAELILGGAEGWLTEELHRTLASMTYRKQVRLTGFIPEQDLGSWLSAADLFVFPSRYEGFGLPPLEAMACGTPVVASTSSSLPEVLGDDALLADPDDIEGIAAAMQRVLEDEVLRQDLSRRGLVRAGRFTWDETARLTRVAYQRAFDQHR